MSEQPKQEQTQQATDSNQETLHALSEQAVLDHHDDKKHKLRAKRLPRKGLTRSKINSMLAVCAIVISAASFYATYLQAKASQEQVAAAKRQLKAETLPWLKMGYSNFDINQEKQYININISNSGTGPAMVHYIEYIYNDENHFHIEELLDTCCSLNAYKEALAEIEQDQRDINYRNAFGWFASSDSTNFLLADGEEFNVFMMQKTNFNSGLWQQIDKSIHDVKVNACYCSILKHCYIVDEKSNIKEVQSCDLPAQEEAQELAE
jgi:hypothetical protein